MNKLICVAVAAPWRVDSHHDIDREKPKMLLLKDISA
jgi:hypothetical protein